MDNCILNNQYDIATAHALPRGCSNLKAYQYDITAKLRELECRYMCESKSNFVTVVLQKNCRVAGIMNKFPVFWDATTCTISDV
jgi:hypothetical protein